MALHLNFRIAGILRTGPKSEQTIHVSRVLLHTAHLQDLPSHRAGVDFPLRVHVRAQSSGFRHTVLDVGDIAQW